MWNSLPDDLLQRVLEHLLLFHGALDHLPAFAVLDRRSNFWAKAHLQHLQHRLGEAGMTALAGALGKGALPLLSDLNLCKSYIGDAGLEALAQVFSNGLLLCLKKLCLAGNQIGDDGITAFALALSQGGKASLQELRLGSNQIGDIGISVLASAVCATPELTVSWCPTCRPHAF